MHQPVTEIFHLRLNTGEDLISEVMWSEKKVGHEDHLTLLNPMKILCIPSKKPGYVTLSLMQWVFTKISSDQEFKIFSRDILTMSKPNPNLKEYYKETVQYFDNKITVDESYEDDMTSEDFLEELEKEINAVKNSDRMIEEDNEDLKNVVSDFLNSLSSNNKGTLH